MKRLLLAASVALALSPALAFASPAPSPSPEPQRWSQDHRRGNRRPVVVQHVRRPVVVVGHDNGRHLGWYKRGGHVPAVYLQPRYYVTDYRAYRLAPPPYGYRWVRPYGDDRYLLVQVATGLIMQVLGY